MIVKHKDTPYKEKGPMKINSYPINKDFSGSLIEIDGNHGLINCPTQNRIYFIIKGTGKFIIEDEEMQVETNDLIFIPKNSKYNIIGKMKYLLICSPEFKPGEDIIYD